jgi:hypothetical protein
LALLLDPAIGAIGQVLAQREGDRLGQAFAGQIIQLSLNGFAVHLTFHR